MTKAPIWSPADIPFEKEELDVQPPTAIVGQKRRGRPPGKRTAPPTTNPHKTNVADPVAPIAKRRGRPPNPNKTPATPKPARLTKGAPAAAATSLTLSEKELNKRFLKDLVASFYQTQKLRIQVGNRVCAHFYKKLGVDAVETLLHQSSEEGKKAADLLDLLKKEYRRVTDALVDQTARAIRWPKYFSNLSEKQRYIYTSYSEYALMSHYRELATTEDGLLRDITDLLDAFPIWTTWLSKIVGIGPTWGVSSSH